MFGVERLVTYSGSVKSGSRYQTTPKCTITSPGDREYTSNTTLTLTSKKFTTGLFKVLGSRMVLLLFWRTNHFKSASGSSSRLQTRNTETINHLVFLQAQSFLHSTVAASKVLRNALASRDVGRAVYTSVVHRYDTSFDVVLLVAEASSLSQSPCSSYQTEKRELSNKPCRMGAYLVQTMLYT